MQSQQPQPLPRPQPQPILTYANDDLPPPPPYSSVNPDMHVDPESQLEPDAFKSGFSISFGEASIRKAFIRKVYGVLACQLTVTMLFITLFLYVQPLREYSFENEWLWILSFVATLVCIIILSCCPDVRRTYPANIIVLGIFTLCESFLLGSIASYYDEEAVLIAVGITTVVVVALTAFAMQSKWDFTMFSGTLFVLLVILFCMGTLCLFIRSSILHIIYASLGAMLFSVYLVFDTQMMLGGRHKYALSPEEYIFAALNLYLDIINLFLFILQIVGRVRSN